LLNAKTRLCRERVLTNVIHLKVVLGIITVWYQFFPCSCECLNHILKYCYRGSMPHKIMDDQTKAAYESQSHQLRADLKKWESDWALAHEGRKPSRDDIKQRPDIGTCSVLNVMPALLG